MGSVPLMYQGSKYAPGPMVAIPVPPTAPLFLSAEIGTVNASTVAVLFDQDISASNYATGVTIKVNGTATSITSATRQTNHAIVRYVIPVLWHGSGDVVTWEYASGSGNIIAESGGIALGDVTAQAVTNNVEYAALLDLQADTLALNDGDPVSTWADQSGLGHDFTQTGTARPTKQTISSYPVVSTNGVSQWLRGGNWIDNLSDFAIVAAYQYGVAGNSSIFINKGIVTATGWECGHDGSMYLNHDNRNYVGIYPNEGLSDSVDYIVSFVESPRYTINIFIDGVEPSLTPDNFGTPGDFSTSSDVAIGSMDYGVANFDEIKLRGILILTPAPSTTNRAALEARLAARYGITL